MDPLRAAAQEVVTPEELATLRTAAGRRPRAYIGFEPSGTAHVGWIVCAEAMQRLIEEGFDLTVLLADWHAQINDKLGGDLAAIRRCGEYMKDAFAALGIPKDAVSYRYAQEFASDQDYWALVIQVAKSTSLARIRRAMDIMGRSQEEADKDVSKFLYPAMQVADIFHLGVDVALGGMDQRHAHMLARDVAKRLGRTPPVAVHTPLVPSLKGQGRMEPGADRDAPAADAAPFAKVSKSDPDSGIFLHDTREDIKRKLKAAHCPAKQVEGNPVMDLLRLVVFPRLARLAAGGPVKFTVPRPAKFGGDKVYVGYEAVEAEFKSGALHPADLKAGVAEAMADVLAPVAAYFETHPENLAAVQALTPTR